MAISPGQLQGALRRCGCFTQIVQRKLLPTLNRLPHQPFPSQKTVDSFLTVMSKHAGGVTAEQKKNWEELLKQAYGDMKQWGWF